MDLLFGINREDLSYFTILTGREGGTLMRVPWMVFSTRLPWKRNHIGFSLSLQLLSEYPCNSSFYWRMTLRVTKTKIIISKK